MDTAVVILNWNGKKHLKRFLPILEKRTVDASLIVIDNCSTDDSVFYLCTNHPDVQIIKNSTNGGYAKGYNDGLKQLKGHYNYYVLINSDVEVTENWLSPLINKLKADDSVAGVQPKVLSFHNKNKFEYAGACGGFMDKNLYPFCRGRIFDEVEEDYGQYDTEKEIFWSTGACMAVRASTFHQLEGFDEDFFAHMEEIDFCWRAKHMGNSFYVIPSSVVYHVGGGTLDYQSPYKTYLNFRNNLYLLVKNYHGWLAGKLIYRMILDGVAGVKFLMGMKLTHVKAVVKAHFSFYKNYSSMLKKRKVIQASRTDENLIGWYNASILWAYFFKKINIFSGLNKRFFKE